MYCHMDWFRFTNLAAHPDRRRALRPTELIHRGAMTAVHLMVEARDPMLEA